MFEQSTIEVVEIDPTAPEVMEPAEPTAPETVEAQGEDVQAEPAEVEPPSTEQPDAKEKALLRAAQEERRKRQEIKEDRDFWHKVAMGEIENPHKKDGELKKPTASDFESYDDYVDALTDYKAAEAIRREKERASQMTKEQWQKREEDKLAAKARKDAEEAMKKYPDFADVAGKVNLGADSMKALYHSDLGAEIAYFLGKNPAEMERIGELSPSRQIMELGKLEVKLAAGKAEPEKKLVKQATKVESAGTGFQPSAENITKLREEAQRSGNWEKYLDAVGAL